MMHESCGCEVCRRPYLLIEGGLKRCDACGRQTMHVPVASGGLACIYCSAQQEDEHALPADE